MAPIVTPSEIQDMLNVSVTEAQISKAQLQIGSEIGRDLSGDLTTYNARQLHLLKMAVVWQAVQPPSPDTIPAPGLASASVNGVAVAYSGGSSSSRQVYLAPLALRCLEKLTRGPSRRTIRAESAALIDALHHQTAVYDDGIEPWRPL